MSERASDEFERTTTAESELKSQMGFPSMASQARRCGIACDCLLVCIDGKASSMVRIAYYLYKDIMYSPPLNPMTESHDSRRCPRGSYRHAGKERRGEGMTKRQYLQIHHGWTKVFVAVLYTRNATMTPGSNRTRHRPRLVSPTTIRAPASRITGLAFSRESGQRI